MGRIKHWCKTCGKPMIDCVCPRKRRKLKVYGHNHHFTRYYAAAYTQVQFARLMGSNLYTLGGCYIMDIPELIEEALGTPFHMFSNNEDFPSFSPTQPSTTARKT